MFRFPFQLFQNYLVIITQHFCAVQREMKEFGRHIDHFALFVLKAKKDSLSSGGQKRAICLWSTKMRTYVFGI